MTPSPIGPVLATVSTPDALVFVVAGAVVLLGALGVVGFRNPVHNALSLVATLFGVAILFVEEDAEFLAAVQVIVYAGAIVVLFLFVIMLLGVDRPERLRADPLPGQRPVAILLGVVILGEILALAEVRHWATGARSVAGTPGGPETNVVHLARAVFTTYLLPFELTSALLVIAVVGAVVLARRPPAGGREDLAATPAATPAASPGRQSVAGTPAAAPDERRAPASELAAASPVGVGTGGLAGPSGERPQASPLSAGAGRGEEGDR